MDIPNEFKEGYNNAKSFFQKVLERHQDKIRLSRCECMWFRGCTSFSFNGMVNINTAIYVSKQIESVEVVFRSPRKPINVLFSSLVYPLEPSKKSLDDILKESRTLKKGIALETLLRYRKRKIPFKKGNGKYNIAGKSYRRIPLDLFVCNLYDFNINAECDFHVVSKDLCDMYVEHIFLDKDLKNELFSMKLSFILREGIICVEPGGIFRKHRVQPKRPIDHKCHMFEDFDSEESEDYYYKRILFNKVAYDGICRRTKRYESLLSENIYYRWRDIVNE